MALLFKSLPFELWRADFERQGIHEKFKPIFKRYICVDDIALYDDILATLAKRAKEESCVTVVFDGEIKLSAEFALIDRVKQELSGIHETQLSSIPITLFKDKALNNIFLSALQEIALQAVAEENFPNESVRNNFISKMILYTYLYIIKLDFESGVCPKCIYYGDIEKHSAYFLKLLHLIGIDVVYINPLRDTDQLKEVDNTGLSVLVKGKNLLALDTFVERSSKGKVINKHQSMTLQFERQLEDELYTGTGAFKPWQFKSGTTTAVFFKSNLIDLENNWKEPARIREGFKVTGDCVYVPHFFFELCGEHKKEEDYADLVMKLQTETSFFTTDAAALVTGSFDEHARFKLVFCQQSDGLFSLERLKELPFYPLGRYRMDLQDFILNKINESLKDTKLFNDLLLTNEAKCNFVLLIFSLAKEVINAIDNFDFTGDIPKLVIFLEGETKLQKEHAQLLGYLSLIGFDIVLLSPSGMSGLSNYISDTRYNNVRLEKVSYIKRYAEVEKAMKRGRGLLKRLFS